MLSAVKQTPTHLLAIRLILVRLGSLEPLDELFSALADLLASGNVDVFLACLGAESLEDILGDKIVLVVLKKNTRNLRDELRLLNTDKTLGTAKESLLVTLGSDHTLEHAAARRDLLDDVIIKDGLGKDGTGAVLVLNVELLCLEVDVDILNLGDASLSLGLGEDPLAENLIRTTTFGILVALDDERVLEVVGKSLGASLDGSLGHVDGPLNLLLFLWLVQLLCLSVDATSELVIAVISLVFAVVITIVIITAIVRTAVLSIGFVAVGVTVLLLSQLLGPTLGLLGGLVLLALGRGILDDKGGKLLARIGLGDGAASLAVEQDTSVLDVYDGLGVLAAPAEDELVDEAVEVVLQLGCLVGTVDDPAIILGINVGLGAEFETEVFDDV